jgi:hypothetical protein
MRQSKKVEQVPRMAFMQDCMGRGGSTRGREITVPVVQTMWERG